MEKDDALILKVDHVSKRFCRNLKRSLFYGVQDILREVAGKPQRQGVLRKDEFWALQNISFQLERGKAVGLLGKNGCGKTTLLRIIAGLIKPTIGQTEVHGRIAPLLSLGAGFNPILSGRENVYVSMSVLGLSKEAIDAKYEEVVDFAEIGYAMDAPLQSYSSGMQARLGFSCAVHTDPDILLLDEVTVVGDIQFQRKCEKKLREVRETGATFIVVSHFAAQIHALCDTAVYLKAGEIVMQGEAKQVIERYEEDLYLTAGKKILTGEAAKPKSTSKFECLEVVLLDEKGVPCEILETMRPAVIKIRFRTDELVSNLHFLLKLFRLPSEDFFTGSEVMILHIGSLEDQCVYIADKGEWEIYFRMDHLMLVQGAYQASIECFGKKEDVFLASRRSDRFVVKSRLPFRHCGFFQPRKWESNLTVDQEKLDHLGVRGEHRDSPLKWDASNEKIRERLSGCRPLQWTHDRWIQWGSLVDLFTTEPATLRWWGIPAQPFKYLRLRPLSGGKEILVGYYFTEGEEACYQVFLPEPLMDLGGYELLCPDDMDPLALPNEKRPLAYRDVHTELVPGNQVITHSQKKEKEAEASLA